MSKLLVGFAAGVLVGVLFAPGTGSETRDRIARRGRELKDKFNDMIDSLSDRFESVKDEADEFAEKAKQKARSYSAPTGNSSWVGDTAK
jgi:gas vesicle protein